MSIMTSSSQNKMAGFVSPNSSTILKMTDMSMKRSCLSMEREESKNAMFIWTLSYKYRFVLISFTCVTVYLSCLYFVSSNFVPSLLWPWHCGLYLHVFIALTSTFWHLPLCPYIVPCILASTFLPSLRCPLQPGLHVCALIALPSTFWPLPCAL